MQTLPIEQSSKEIYTVSQLNSKVRFLLENQFPFVWVEGEVSNFAAPHSGHWYFSLKDHSAQIKCAMFKGSQRKLDFIPKDGMHVLLKAKVSLYENRGDFQLIAEYMEERGEGKLRRAFEMLKKKLEAGGLFDLAHKKKLPLYPKQIGIITSATGAAIRDILHVLKRRYTCAPIIIYPTLVQGNQAAAGIVNALQLANQRQECDVLILARGGGSLEDLWPFNEEIVAHAIYASEIPIISGVGHEIDFTIADFVADVRAPTPSAAAEIITPDKMELLSQLNRYKQQIQLQCRNQFANIKQRLHWIETRLQQQHPRRQLREKMQSLDFFETHLAQLLIRFINKQQVKTKDLTLQLQQHSPILKMKMLEHQIQLDLRHVNMAMIGRINKLKMDLANLASKLDALSPLATLQRGYAIASKNGNVLNDARVLEVGDEIDVKLMTGSVECCVSKVN